MGEERWYHRIYPTPPERYRDRHKTTTEGYCHINAMEHGDKNPMEYSQKTETA